MKADEIRELVAPHMNKLKEVPNFMTVSDMMARKQLIVLAEIAAQLADLNQSLGELK